MIRPSLPRIRQAVPPELRPSLERLVRGAEAGAFHLFLVGGPVRDLLLGRRLRDVDLLVLRREGSSRGAALELARSVAESGERVVGHERFGTAELRGRGTTIDLASARRESYAHPGALPVVVDGSLEEDLRRRDFTVNGLAVALNPAARRAHPGVVDPGSGLSDLEARLLRVFHRRSFHDDPTRAFRAARLGPRLGFRLTRSSRGALRDALRDGAFGAVSGERFRAELEKLFTQLEASEGGGPAAALQALEDTHVLSALEPGLALPTEARAPLRRLGRWLIDPPPAVAPERPWLAGLMVWLSALPAGLRRRALRRLAVEGALAARVSALPAAARSVLARLGRARGRGAADALLGDLAAEELAAVAALASPALRRRVERHAREDRSVVLPLSGEDLLELGLEGPAVGRALARLRVAVLDRLVRSREDALALARELGRPKGR